MSIALSGHGAHVYYALAETPTVWVEIAECGDITMPGFDHNEFDATTHNQNIDRFVMGVLRRDLITISLNFLPQDSTHDHLTGLLSRTSRNPVPTDGLKFVYPDNVTTVIVSGNTKSVKNIKLPVDGLSTGDMEFRANGKMLINGVVIGN